MWRLPLWWAWFAGYFIFLPAIIAHSQATKHRLLITLLNVLLGWTLVGWIAAILWALVDSVRDFPPFKPAATADGITVAGMPGPSVP